MSITEDINKADILFSALPAICAFRGIDGKTLEDINNAIMTYKVLVEEYHAMTNRIVSLNNEIDLLKEELRG